MNLYLIKKGRLKDKINAYKYHLKRRKHTETNILAHTKKKARNKMDVRILIKRKSHCYYYFSN